MAEWHDVDGSLDDVDNDGNDEDEDIAINYTSTSITTVFPNYCHKYSGSEIHTHCKEYRTSDIISFVNSKS